VISDAIVGRIAIERWISAICNFQLRACKKLTPTAMVTAWPPDVLATFGGSFHSAVMLGKRLAIGVGERCSLEQALHHIYIRRDTSLQKVRRDTSAIELVHLFFMWLSC
jgi:hypothetical protein